MKNNHTLNSKITTIVFFCLLILACKSQTSDTPPISLPADIETLKSRLALETEADPDSEGQISKGTFAVYENRESQSGRMIHLEVVVLHATGADPRPDPVFIFAGGPGANVARYGYRRSWLREKRDIVLVSQRGTGGDNRLDCPLAASDDDLQGYLDPLFDTATFRACMEKLQQDYDLTQYSTCLAADDLNDVRLALGYDKINVTGGSYGTRMALVYMRRHPQTVRTAILNGVAPIGFKNPLYHSPSGHAALQLMMKECAQNQECASAFPNLEQEFQAIMQKLEKEPADVTITHPVTEERVPVKLSKAAFAEALRTIMYYSDTNHRVPYLIHRAYEGDYEPFAQRGMESNRRIRQLLALGMLLCVTCAEDLARISETEIVEVTSGTFLGDDRVRQQMAVCEFWPKSNLPDNYGDPVNVGMPVLLLSGTLDPVTPPNWGAEAASHLPNSLHLVVPGAHGVGGECIRDIQLQFLDTGSVLNLDTACTETIPKIQFEILN